METEALVSISLPVYNGEATLRESIESVLAQTYQNFELLIVDDCSTDGSRDIIESFRDDRIRTIYLKENENVCNAENTAFLAAKGKYIATIGHDDVWKAEKLEKQVAYMEANDACGVCFTWVDIIDEEGRLREDSSFTKLFRQKNRTRQEWVCRLFYQMNCFCAPSVLIRKTVLEQAGIYRYSLLQLQDYELWMRLALYAELYILEENLTCYRRAEKSGKNLSADVGSTYTRTTQELMLIQYDFLKGLSDEQYTECFGSRMRNPQAATHEEYECEKAFALLDCNNPMGRYWMADLMEQEQYRLLLKQTYGYGLQDFYKLTAIPFQNSVEVQEKTELLQRCREIIAKQQAVIESLRRN